MKKLQAGWLAAKVTNSCVARLACAPWLAPGLPAQPFKDVSRPPSPLEPA